MRDSLSKLREATNTVDPQGSDPKWFLNLDSSQWLYHLSKILEVKRVFE